MEPSTSWSQATIVVITGGSSGIGRAAALAFADAAAAAGALSQQRVARPLALVIADVDQEGGEETCLLARQRGADAADFMKTDVRIEQDVAALGAWVGSRWVARHSAGRVYCLAKAREPPVHWLQNCFVCCLYRVPVRCNTIRTAARPRARAPIDRQPPPALMCDITPGTASSTMP